MSRLVALVAILVLSGCAGGRLADLRDSFRMSAGLGLGLSADAKLGALTHPSLGIFSASAMLGYDSRDVYGEFYEARVSEPYATDWFTKEGDLIGSALNKSGWRAAFETHRYHETYAAVFHPIGQERPAVIAGTVEGVELSGTVDEGYWLPLPGTGPGSSFNDLTDLQIGGTLLMVSVRAGANPLEFIDFLLGFVGVDIAGDDE